MENKNVWVEYRGGFNYERPAMVNTVEVKFFDGDEDTVTITEEGEEMDWFWPEEVSDENGDYSMRCPVVTEWRYV